MGRGCLPGGVEEEAVEVAVVEWEVEGCGSGRCEGRRRAGGAPSGR